MVTMIQTTKQLLSLFLLSSTLLELAAVRPTDAADTLTSGWKPLFNGQDLTQWAGRDGKGTGDWLAAGAVSLDPSDPKRFTVEPGKGVLVNGMPGRTVDLMTTEEFGDVEAHIEFAVPRNSNSGVYFQGHTRCRFSITGAWPTRI